jgi:hypothetical protein
MRVLAPDRGRPCLVGLRIYFKYTSPRYENIVICYMYIALACLGFEFKILRPPPKVSACSLVESYRLAHLFQVFAMNSFLDHPLTTTFFKKKKKRSREDLEANWPAEEGVVVHDSPIAGIYLTTSRNTDRDAASASLLMRVVSPKSGISLLVVIFHSARVSGLRSSRCFLRKQR